MDASDPTRSGQRRFAVFVSYSHRDHAIGSRLFGRLDGYRTPRALVGKPGAFGPVRATLYPCFRDREELSASADVKRRLDAALMASDHLVVVCSPDAAQSPWVAHEIRTFVAARGIERVHTALIAGEPAAAFPQALRESGLHTPLAADLRPEGDGFERGVLKLVAGVLGVPLGELEDRELARRRARTRVTFGIVVGFAALFLSACGASWVALDRSERLQIALVEVIRQLSGQLDELYEEQGKTLTTAEVERQLAFVRRLTDAAFVLAPDSERLRKEEMRTSLVYARHLLAVGQTADAVAETERVVSVYDTLQGAAEADLEARRHHAVALRLRGGALGRMGRDEDGAESLSQAIAALAGLDDLEARREVARALSALGALEQRAHDYDAAAQHYLEAAELRATLLATHPGDPDLRAEQVEAWEALGDVAFDRGDTASAEEEYQRALEAARALNVAHAADMTAYRAVAAVQQRLAAVAVKLGHRDEAAQRIEEAVAIAEELAARDPGNVVASHDLTLVYLDHARVAEELGMIEVQTGLLRRVVARATEDVRKDPGNVLLRVDLVRAIVDLAQVEDHSTGLSLEGEAVVRKAAELGVELPPEVRRVLLLESDWRMQRPATYDFDPP